MDPSIENGDLDLSSPLLDRPKPVPGLPVYVDLRQLGYLLSVPTIAMLLGSILIFFINPGPKSFAAMQHLAAGLILGAVLWELGPEMGRETHNEKQALCGGFILGFVGLMFMARFDLKITCSNLLSVCIENQNEELENQIEPKGDTRGDMASTSSIPPSKEEECEDLEHTTKSNFSDDSAYSHSPTKTPPKKTPDHDDDLHTPGSFNFF